MTLSNDQIRVKVAELLGWTSKLVPPTGNNPYGEHQYTWWTNSEGQYAPIPNYPLSLDACAEGFEKGMTKEQFDKYEQWLWDELDCEQQGIRPFLCATPLQRCLAFIATMENKL